MWTADSEKASIVIDLKQEREICAVGNYPRIISRAEAPKEVLLDYVSTIPTEVEVYVGTDGVNYTKCAGSICRAFGAEHIITFEPIRARYVRFDVLSNAGKFASPVRFANAKTSVANLTVFEKKDRSVIIF